MKKGVTIFWILIIGIIVLAFGSSFLLKAAPGQHDKLAQCIKEQGAIFYGAFWCPHCQNTKALFGNSAKLLPYVECSTPDGKGQIQACKDAGIQSYPTWTRPDGATLNGEHPMAKIAAFAGCTVEGEKTDFEPVETAPTTTEDESAAVQG